MRVYRVSKIELRGGPSPSTSARSRLDPRVVSVRVSCSVSRALSLSRPLLTSHQTIIKFGSPRSKKHEPTAQHPALP
eukprot:scaffold73416_cov57-Phaeocystis_antarctica.AAC.4